MIVNNIALGIEYDGKKYYGWQRQNNVCSIQYILEKAISKVANNTINVFCAGRTDAGVHSIGQVVNFFTSAVRNKTAWTLGVNANLPNDIAVKWAKLVPLNFNARLSAIARRYSYIIYNNSMRSAILNKGMGHYYLPLDSYKMHNAAQFLVGENDFSSFRSVHCQSRTPCRNVIYISVNRFNNYVIIDIKANAFLYRMVRNIVGSLIKVGSGNKPENWIFEILKAKNRNFAAETAKAEGLYLISVDYPEIFNIPKQTNFSAIFSGIKLSTDLNFN